MILDKDLIASKEFLFIYEGYIYYTETTKGYNCKYRKKIFKRQLGLKKKGIFVIGTDFLDILQIYLRTMEK